MKYRNLVKRRCGKLRQDIPDPHIQPYQAVFCQLHHRSRGKGFANGCDSMNRIRPHVSGAIKIMGSSHTIAGNDFSSAGDAVCRPFYLLLFHHAQEVAVQYGNVSRIIANLLRNTVCSSFDYHFPSPFCIPQPTITSISTCESAGSKSRFADRSKTGSPWMLKCTLWIPSQRR